MITRVGMAPRAAGLTYTAFQEHWRSEHAGLAGELPGLRGYIQNHAVLGEGRPLLPYPGFDACSEISFDSLAAMDDAFASEHYLGAVTADEHSLIDKSRFGLLLTERRVLLDGDAAHDSVKLLTFLPLDPRSTREALDDVLAGPYREIVAEAGPLRHEQLLEIPGAHEGRLPPGVRGRRHPLVREPRAGARVRATARSGHRAGYALAGTAFGLERVLARPIRIV